MLDLYDRLMGTTIEPAESRAQAHHCAQRLHALHEIALLQAKEAIRRMNRHMRIVEHEDAGILTLDLGLGARAG